MSCSESPAANSFLVDSLISSGRGEAAGAGGGGGGGGGYYPNSGIYLPQASDLSYGLQSCGLFPVLGKRNEGTSQSMVPGSHPYVSGMEVWLDPPRSCRMEEPESQQATSCSFAPRPGRSSPGRQGLEAGRLRLPSSPCFPPPEHTYKVQIRRIWGLGFVFWKQVPGLGGGGGGWK
uniref:Homeobox protein A10 n=1 Tax=Accipiter nisus TaxID=211598 RepID=A0A8B9MF91_9AVES